MRSSRRVLLPIFIGLFCVSFLNVKAENPSREVRVSDLPELLSSNDGIQTLHEEFSTIEGGERRPWTVAALPENIKKNRYEDLLAFDHSRVVLEKLPDDPFSDYINANYIDGRNSEREYVATQGPLPHTIDDFWRMIWQLNASKIVMLANVVEHGEVKVEKYWPETIATYGEIQVTKITEFSIPHVQHIVRTFAIVRITNRRPGTVRRVVRQFHFTGWPDLGVPTDRLPVISLIRQARQYDPEKKAPLVIHCSAGIGRTGTVILMDSVMQKAEVDGIVDFPKRLDHMRTQRPDLVEKKEQYVFAHQAVNDDFNVPGTQERLEEVAEEYRILDSQMSPRQLMPPGNLNETVLGMWMQNVRMQLLVDENIGRNKDKVEAEI